MACISPGNDGPSVGPNFFRGGRQVELQLCAEVMNSAR